MRKNLVAMLLAVGVIATAAGCGSTESTSTTSTTEYVTEEATTEAAQVEETTEYVEAATEEVAEESAEEITVDELTVKVREAMEAAPYIVSDYTVLADTAGTNGGYNSYYNKETNMMYNECELNGTYWVDFNISTVYLLDASSNSYNLINDESTAQTLKRLALNIDDIYKTGESSAVCTLDNIVDSIATVIINNTLDNGNKYTSVVTINTETGLIESYHYTESSSDNEVIGESELNLSYPAEGTPDYDEFIQKTTIPAEAIEAANNQ